MFFPVGEIGGVAGGGEGFGDFEFGGVHVFFFLVVREIDCGGGDGLGPVIVEPGRCHF